MTSFSEHRSDSEPGSVTHWLDGMRAGDQQAAQELWNRYFERLVTVANVSLRGGTASTSAEDVALSAIGSVLIGIRQGRFPLLSDRTGLWPLLVTIAARKSISHLRRKMARKRNPTAEGQLREIRDLIGVEPSPAFAVDVADELAHLLHSLKDPSLRRLVELKLWGANHEEIAGELGCSIRTVIRKLNLVRREWQLLLTTRQKENDDSNGK